MKSKVLFFFILNILFITRSFAQSYSIDKNTFGNYIVRMFQNAPFEGVKIVEDDTFDKYIISVVILNPNDYTNESIMQRVASVKASAQASKFFNGSYITQDCIIRTSKSNNKQTNSEIVEFIKEQSFGLIKGLEILSTFKQSTDKVVFIFISKDDENKQSTPQSKRRNR